MIVLYYMNGLVQERRNSSASAMELRLSCTNPPIWYMAIPILLKDFVLEQPSVHKQWIFVYFAPTN